MIDLNTIIGMGLQRLVLLMAFNNLLIFLLDIGMIMSDWTGVYTTSDSIKAGVDLEMPYAL